MTPEQRMLADQSKTVAERIAEARAKRQQREDLAAKILSKPKRKDTNGPRG